MQCLLSCTANDYAVHQSSSTCRYGPRQYSIHEHCRMPPQRNQIKAPALKRHCSKVTRRGDCTPNSSDHDTNHTTQNIHIQTEHQHAWIRQGNRQQHNCPSCATNARHPTQVPCCLSGCNQETSQPAGHCGFIPACLFGPDSKTAVQVWLHPKGKAVVSPINRTPLRSYYINRIPRVMTCAGPCDRHCCDCKNSRPSCQCCCGLADKIHEDPISDARYVTEDLISGCSWCCCVPPACQLSLQILQAEGAQVLQAQHLCRNNTPCHFAGQSNIYAGCS